MDLINKIIECVTIGEDNQKAFIEASRKYLQDRGFEVTSKQKKPMISCYTVRSCYYYDFEKRFTESMYNLVNQKKDATITVVIYIVASDLEDITIDDPYRSRDDVDAILMNKTMVQIETETQYVNIRIVCHNNIDKTEAPFMLLKCNASNLPYLMHCLSTPCETHRYIDLNKIAKPFEISFQCAGNIVFNSETSNIKKVLDRGVAITPYGKKYVEVLNTAYEKFVL